MKVLMTGARGRLGRALRPFLSAQGIDVLPLSRTPDAEHRPLASLAAAAGESDVDAILHLAWSTVPATAEGSATCGQDENVSFLRAYLESASAQLAAGIRMPRIIFFSSCAVYGEPRIAGDVFAESDATAPIGRYAESKVCAENLLAEYRAIGGDALVLRVTNPYGFQQSPGARQGVIPALLRAALSGEPFQLWGEGDTIKDYIHVEDFCRAVACALEAPARVFNIASGESIALSDVIGMVQELTGKAVKVDRKPARLWDVKMGRYTAEAFHGVTHWEPRIDFRAGIDRFVSEVSLSRHLSPLGRW